MLMRLIISNLSKLKRNFVWKITFLIPLLSIALLQLLILFQFESIEQFCKAKEMNPWILLISQNSGPVLWPSIINIVIMVVSIFVYQVEFKNNSLNTELCIPAARWKILVSKFFVILFFTYIAILINFFGLILIGIFNKISEPFMFEFYFKYVLYELISVIGTVALSNWIASLFKNAIVPYVIGILGFGFGLLLPYEFKQLSYFCPYSYPLYAANYGEFHWQVAVIGGIAAGGIILLLSSYEFKHRDIL